jgi:hypothetical protein
MIHCESLLPFEIREIKRENFMLRYTFQFLVKRTTSVLRHVTITLSNVVMSLPCCRNKLRLRVCFHLISYIHRFD